MEIETWTDFRDIVENDQRTFYDVQAIAFGVCSYLRGYMVWPKVRRAYEDFKPFFGKRSMMNKKIGWSQFDNMRRGDYPEQFCAYKLLSSLYSYQTEDQDYEFALSLGVKGRQIIKLPGLPKKVLAEIIEDSVNFDKTTAPIKPRVKFHPEVRNMIKLMKLEEKYQELPILADMLEDFHSDTMMDFANHFRQGRHTYACRYLKLLEWRLGSGFSF